MNCQELVARLSDYIDGTLDATTRAGLEEHLASCHDCHVVLDSTECTILLSRAAGATMLSTERRALLLHRLEAACRDCGRPESSSSR